MCRVEIFQHVPSEDDSDKLEWTHILSCNFMNAARDKISQEGFKVPAMNFEHSEDAHQAKLRDQISRELQDWLKMNPPSEILAQPPTQSEFDLITKLYELSKKEDVNSRFILMPETV